MFRVEATGKHGQIGKFDLPNEEEAFRKAAHLLGEGFPEVKVWLNGPRNMPLTLNTDNWYEMYRVHVWRPQER